jgi:hypothetical protein
MVQRYMPDTGDIVWISFDRRLDMNRLGSGPQLCSARPHIRRRPV